MRKCLRKSRDLHPPRGRKVMILDELRGELKLALNECLLFQLSAKDLSPGTMERRIFSRMWRDCQNICRRMKLVSDNF